MGYPSRDVRKREIAPGLVRIPGGVGLTVPGAPTADPALPGAGAAYRPQEWLAGSASRFGMIVFLASDVMLFAAFFSAYYVLRGTNDPWPPEGVELDVPRALIATIVLVSSSFTLIAADRAIATGQSRLARRWVLGTVALMRVAGRPRRAARPSRREVEAENLMLRRLLAELRTSFVQVRDEAEEELSRFGTSSRDLATHRAVNS